ncbi:sensor domain-containing diguanylate cyclase [Halomonas sp. ANAO-440]|uniref:sensor domain-containing diguanylate cyclase n=1 Tax=Halomonas sp. ANAO-440 TaxID=2861360 RepID=UPI001CAA698B|nr:sensor domain-containing diguanylate cyclase [Halomonas sp. ANAO-440]MBZ0331030.1 sensor domain-containing diguanylate cyclase [Halomonas sp. ANAO-440]
MSADLHRITTKRDFDRSLIEAIHEASPDGILVVDDQGMIVSHNRRLFEVFDIPLEALPGDHGGNLSGYSEQAPLALAMDRLEAPEAFLKRTQELYDDPSMEDHCELSLKDGRTLERFSKALWGNDKRYLGRVWFFRDITPRKEVERKLEVLARRDPLTGVANRRHFFELSGVEVARARRYGAPLSLAMLDLDHFKQINDRFGHSAGDRVLINFCNDVATLLRESDVLARLGGEEFVVLLPGSDPDGAFQLAERLRGHAEKAIVEEGESRIRYTVSAGVASLTPDDASIETVMGRADDALYAAKAAGRNCTRHEAPR